jgi:hypothetical protein
MKRMAASNNIRYHNKKTIKIRSSQHEHTSQCDDPAWLTSERGAGNSWFPFHWWSKPPHHVKVIHSGRQRYTIPSSVHGQFASTTPIHPIVVVSTFWGTCCVSGHLLLITETSSFFLYIATRLKCSYFFFFHFWWCEDIQDICLISNQARNTPHQLLGMEIAVRSKETQEAGKRKTKKAF